MKFTEECAAWNWEEGTWKLDFSELVIISQQCILLCIISKRCKECEEFNKLHHAPSEKLHSIRSPWPFVLWGMDILGPFPIVKGQVKFLLVTIDYFAKWIEVEPLAKIIAQKV